MSKAKAYFYAFGFAALLIYTSLFLAMNEKEEVHAQSYRTPFAGQIASIMLCCNGLQFYTTGQYQSAAYGSFIMNWPTMIPVPQAGIGLYSYWAILPTEKVLGDSIIGGTCQTIVSECAATEPVNYTVMQMGTTLSPSF